MYDIAEAGGLFRDYAFTNGGAEPLTAGAVPEPTVAALFCFGLTFATALHRPRRRHAPLV